MIKDPFTTLAGNALKVDHYELPARLDIGPQVGTKPREVYVNSTQP